MATLVIVNPTSGESPPQGTKRTLLDSLRGETVGFLSNSKMNADKVLEGVAEGLVARFGIIPRLYVKRVPSISAGKEMLDEIGRDCAAAVVAMLDCGSCASCASCGCSRTCGSCCSGSGAASLRSPRSERLRR